MLTLEYDPDAVNSDDDDPTTRVAYAPVQLPRRPVPRIKVTEPDDIPFVLRMEEIPPEWLNPPPRLVKRRTWEEDLVNARKVWRRSTGLSFVAGEPEVLCTRRITDEELAEGWGEGEVGDTLGRMGGFGGGGHEEEEGEEGWDLPGGRRRDIPSFIAGKPEVLQVRRIADDELHMGVAGGGGPGVGGGFLPETPPDSPMDYYSYPRNNTNNNNNNPTYDAHTSIAQASSYSSLSTMSINSSSDSPGIIPILDVVSGGGLTRRRSGSLPAAAAAARHARKESLTRSPSVRRSASGRTRSGSSASTASFQGEQDSPVQAVTALRVRKISTDFSTGRSREQYMKSLAEPEPRSNSNGLPVTPPISPPTPTATVPPHAYRQGGEGHDANPSVRDMLPSLRTSTTSMQYSPIGNPYQLHYPSNQYTYQPYAYNPSPYSAYRPPSSSHHTHHRDRNPNPEPDPEVSSLSDISSLSSFSVSISGSSAGAGGEGPSRGGSLSSPTRQVRSADLWEGGGEGNAGELMTGGGGGNGTGKGNEMGRGYNNGDYFYQQYQLHEQLDDIAALGLGLGLGMGMGRKQSVASDDGDDGEVYVPRDIDSNRDPVRRRQLVDMDADVDVNAEVPYTPSPNDARRNRSFREVITRKALPPRSSYPPPPSPSDNELTTDPTMEKHEEDEAADEDEYTTADEANDASDDDDPDEAAQATARLRRMREMARERAKEIELREVREREREMQRAAVRAAGAGAGGTGGVNVKVNVIKRKPVMNMSVVGGGGV